MTTSLSRTRIAPLTTGVPRRIVIVDPTGSESLETVAALSGLPVRRVPSWPFEIDGGDRLITTVPVPAGARDAALGVLPAGRLTPLPALGEVWPDRTLPLEGCEADVLAYVMDRHAPRAPVVAVWSSARGLGVSWVAAGLARRLAGEPLAVALVDLSGGQEALLQPGPGLRWTDLAEDPGPFLPGRLDLKLPTWERVRLLAGKAPAHVNSSLYALAASHDVVVVDAGAEPQGVLAAAKDISVELRTASKGSAGALPGSTRASARNARPIAAPAPTPCPAPSGEGGPAGPLAVVLERGSRGPADGNVLPYPNERGLAAASARGEKPLDRPRGSAGKAIRGLAELIVERL